MTKRKWYVIRYTKKKFANLNEGDIIVLFSTPSQESAITLSKKITQYSWAYNTITVNDSQGDLVLSCINENCDRGAVIKISKEHDVYECRHCGTTYTVNHNHSVDME